MYFSKLNTLLAFSVVLTLVCFNQMTVIDLTKFLIVEILNEKTKHFLILFFKALLYILSFHFFFLYRSVNQIDWLHLFWNKFTVPTNKEVITIEIWTTYLSSYRDLSFFGKDDTINKLTEYIFFSSLLKSNANFSLRNTLHFSNICWMKTWISSNNDISLNMLFFGI